jgi:hypothetical protein
MMFMKGIEKAKELGCERIEGGINWTWAIHFPSDEVAKRFTEWLDANGYDHRGVYYPDFSVRFR